MHNFDTITLRVFLAIAREGSIGAASRKEHIAASAISRRVNDLELDLGVELLRRSPSGVALTPAGRAFAKRCEEILEAFSSARAEVRAYSDGGSGELRIGGINSALAGDFPHILKAYMAANPAVEVSLFETSSTEAVRLLREDRADLMLVSDTVEAQGFETLEYSVDPIWVVGAKEHPLFAGRAAMEPIPFDAVLDHELMSLHEGGALEDLISAALRKAGKSRKRRFRVIRFDPLRKFAEAGLGLGFLRASSVEPYLDSLEIRGAPLSDDWALRRMVFLFPKGQGVAPTVLKFLDFWKSQQG